MTNIITESESDRSTDRNLGLEWQMVTFPALAYLASPSMQISIRVVRLVDVAHCGAFFFFFSQRSFSRWRLPNLTHLG
jgi:hypothetical protein